MQLMHFDNSRARSITLLQSFQYISCIARQSHTRGLVVVGPLAPVVVV